jgi:hypothetical protein
MTVVLVLCLLVEGGGAAVGEEGICEMGLKSCVLTVGEREWNRGNASARSSFILLQSVLFSAC